MRMPTRSMLSFVSVSLCSAMFWTGFWTARAQSNSGSISGTVTDPHAFAVLSSSSLKGGCYGGND